MRYFVTVEGEEFEVEVESGSIRVNGEPVEADLVPLPGTSFRNLLLGGRSHTLMAHRNGDGEWSLDLDGGPVRVEVLDRAGRAIRELTRRVSVGRGPDPLLAPMPGMVVKVDVAEGEAVSAGRAVVVVEAMKMENELQASGSGVVKKVHVTPGQAVERGDVLMEFQEPEEGEGPDG